MSTPTIKPTYPDHYKKMDERLDVTVAQFRRFAETRPPNEVYDFGKPCECPVAEYLKSQGEIEYVRQAGMIPKPIYNCVNPPRESPRTYGALVERLLLLEYLGIS